MGFGFYLIFYPFPTTLEIDPTVGSFLDDGHGAYPNMVSHTTVSTKISLPDSPWSQEHKFPNSLLTCDFKMQQLSKGLKTDQTLVSKSIEDLVIAGTRPF